MYDVDGHLVAVHVNSLLTKIDVFYVIFNVCTSLHIIMCVCVGIFPLLVTHLPHRCPRTPPVDKQNLLALDRSLISVTPWSQMG